MAPYQRLVLCSQNGLEPGQTELDLDVGVDEAALQVQAGMPRHGITRITTWLLHCIC